MNAVTEETNTSATRNNNDQAKNNDIDSLFTIIRPVLEQINPDDRFSVNLNIMKVVQDAKMQYLSKE